MGSNVNVLILDAVTFIRFDITILFCCSAGLTMVQVVNWSQASTNHGTSGALVPGPHKSRYKWRTSPRPHKPWYKWCTGPRPPQTTVQVAHWSQVPQTTVQVVHWSQAPTNHGTSGTLVPGPINHGTSGTLVPIPQTTVQVVHWYQAPTNHRIFTLINTKLSRQPHINKVQNKAFTLALVYPPSHWR